MRNVNSEITFGHVSTEYGYVRLFPDTFQFTGGWFFRISLLQFKPSRISYSFEINGESPIRITLYIKG